MPKFFLALAAALVLASTANAQIVEYTTPIKIHVGPENCHFLGVRPADALPIWYGFNIDSNEHMAQCDAVSRAIEDHAALAFKETFSPVSCPTAVCGATSALGVTEITRDPSVLVITLVVGGPPVHVTGYDCHVYSAYQGEVY